MIRTNTAEDLYDIVTRSYEKMALIDESVFGDKPDPLKWSKKEIVGHLVDSAINNLLRITQLQYNDELFIAYDQNKCVIINKYQDMKTSDIINLWKTYNTHLAALIRDIPSQFMDKTILLNNNATNAKLIIEDYITHLQHHLKQII